MFDRVTRFLYGGNMKKRCGNGHQFQAKYEWEICPECPVQRVMNQGENVVLPPHEPFFSKKALVLVGGEPCPACGKRVGRARVEPSTERVRAWRARKKREGE
jgi:hypothetical protein